MTAEKLIPVARLPELKLSRRDRSPGLGATETNVSRAIGLTRLGASYFEVNPGDAAFPFHAHFAEDEIIYIIAGQGTYRFGEDLYEVRAGDMLAAPSGNIDRAHQLTNTGQESLKYICISNVPEINVSELPEEGIMYVTRRAHGDVAGSRFTYKLVDAK